MLDAHDLSQSDYLIYRGWRLWSRDNLTRDRSDDKLKVLLLCPLLDFHNVPDGTVMYSIMGDTAVKGIDDIDLDTRAGIIAWGVLFEEGDIHVPDVNKKYRSIDDQ